jgi:hypothetical protein
MARTSSERPEYVAAQSCAIRRDYAGFIIVGAEPAAIRAQILTLRHSPSSDAALVRNF